MSYFEITWQRLAVMPLGIGVTLYSVFFGFQKFVNEKDTNIKDKSFNNNTLV